MFIMKLNWGLEHGQDESSPQQKKFTVGDTAIQIVNKIGTKYKWFEDCTYPEDLIQLSLFNYRYYLAFIINFLMLISYSSLQYVVQRYIHS
jgi:hypothetical protein